MPFTFSHPAAVLPFRIFPRNWFSFTGLIIGSLVPDFEYFLCMHVETYFSHTLAGIFLFDLPVGIIMAFVFYGLAINPVLNNGPVFLTARFSFLKNSDWNTYFKNNPLKVCASIIIGTISHIVWDNFTHLHGHFAQAFTILSKSVYVFGRQMAIFNLLQHLSTLLGAFFILVYIWLLPVDTNHRSDFSKRYWVIAALIFVVLILFRIQFGLGKNWVNNLAVSCISSGMIAIISAPFLIFNKKQNC